MSERSERAVALFKAGASCSQAVVAAFADRIGMDEAAAMRMASGFGGGIGRMREVCGVMCGLTMLAGMRRGNAAPEDAEGKKAVYALVQELAAAFRAEFGSIICRQLLGLEKPEGDPTPAPRTEQYYRKRPCSDFVAFGASLAEKLIFTE